MSPNVWNLLERQREWDSWTRKGTTWRWLRSVKKSWLCRGWRSATTLKRNLQTIRRPGRKPSETSETPREHATTWWGGVTNRFGRGRCEAQGRCGLACHQSDIHRGQELKWSVRAYLRAVDGVWRLTWGLCAVYEGSPEDCGWGVRAHLRAVKGRVWFTGEVLTDYKSKCRGGFTIL